MLSFVCECCRLFVSVSFVCVSRLLCVLSFVCECCRLLCRLLLSFVCVVCVVVCCGVVVCL